MFGRRFALMGACLAAAALGGCQTGDRTNWGQVAAGTAMVLAGSGATGSVDPKIARASEQLAAYCPMLQVAGAIAGGYLVDKQRAAVLQANAAVNEVCLTPPRDVAAAVIVAARAYDAAKAARVLPAPS